LKIWLKHDLPAGLSVFFVALPLCLGISLASGAPLYAGILSGIIGGMIVSLISGSALGVSGPAAGLTPIVAGAILAHGDYRIFLLSVVLAGAFQLALGLLKLGVITNYFPSAVIKGMLAAIGIMLIAKQVPVALGYDQPDFWSSGVKNFFSSHNLPGSIRNFNFHITKGAVIITCISLLVLLLLQQRFARRLKIIPAPLLAVLTGVVANFIFLSLAPHLSVQQNQLVNIPANVFADISFPDFSRLFSYSGIWKDAAVIALLASLETLLCLEAIDKLDKHNRITPVNRELVAQGIGNMACGLLGAIPMTAVIVRGAANVDAGGRTRMASFTHGVFLLLAVLLLSSLLNYIPYASLAAILIFTGYNLTKPKLYRNMWELGLKQFLPFIFTITICLITQDLLMGVIAGVLFATYYIIRNNFKAEYKIQHRMIHETEVFTIKLNSNVSFLNKVTLKETLDKIPPYSVLTIDGSDCNFIDYDILEIISEFRAKAHDRHIEVHLDGIKEVNITAIH
jgi:MFS superfamily sulfate permease-like transporter